MRILLAITVTAGFCFAQDPPQAPAPSLKDKLYEAGVTAFTVIPPPQNWIPLPATVAPVITIAPKNSRCSVPLLAATPRNGVQFTTPQIHPPAEKYTMIQAIVPAPSCDSISEVTRPSLATRDATPLPFPS